jgi:hypothetical protein
MDNNSSDDGNKVTENQAANDDKVPSVLKMPNRKYGYFRDDQITFLVTHTKQVTNDDLMAFGDKISEFLKGMAGGFVDGVPKATSFPEFTLREPKPNAASPREAFSIIRCSLKEAPLDPLQQLQNIGKLANDDKVNGTTINGLTIQAIAPDWITSVTSQGAGTGGPGSIPLPYYGSRKNAPYNFSDLMGQLDDCGLYGDGDGVDVVILDTAPSAHDLAAAYKEWQDHPLIGSLLGPEGKLHLYPTDYEETVRLGNTSLNGSDYKMTDHGLFIAGIIHSIVPKAEIHLYEVLNQYGVGDSTSFTSGLEKVLNNPKFLNRKLVINCSWMLDFPGDEQHCHHPYRNRKGQVTDPDVLFEQEVLLYFQQDASTLIMLRALFDQFSANGKRAIAAAGNDAYDDDTALHVRPKARYPAALKEVTGVGALPNPLEIVETGNGQRKLRTSKFSNVADEPGLQGIVTLGGEAGEGNGILGLYIGEFPDGRRNISKWAWWAGTSFATPIITATVAAVLSSQPAISTTQDALGALYTKHIIENDRTDAKEDALATTQC